MSPSAPCAIIDAFASTSYSGNPAAVVLFKDDHASSWDDAALCQKQAAEFNLSETAFISPIDLEKGEFKLRWFTPSTEVPLCGHATLASAHYIFTNVLPTLSSISFQNSFAGTLTAKKLDDGWIELDFPAENTVLKPLAEEEAEKNREIVSRAAGVKKDQVLQVRKSTNMGWIVQIESTVNLEELKVDNDVVVKELGGLLNLTQSVSTPSSTSEQIRSRVFAPHYGIVEDPVTGAAHCAFAPFWLGTNLLSSLQGYNGEELRARQVSKRGGDVRLAWDQETGRVKLRGQAKLVVKGDITLE